MGRPPQLGSEHAYKRSDHTVEHCVGEVEAARVEPPDGLVERERKVGKWPKLRRRIIESGQPSGATSCSEHSF